MNTQPILTNQKSRASSRTRAARAVVAALIAMAVAAWLMATPASAEPPAESGVVDRGDGSLGFVYWSDGHLAMVFDIETFCANPEPPQGPGAMYVAPGNGSSIELNRATVPISVYAYPGPDDTTSGFDWLFSNCLLIWDGDPATQPAEPLATGSVELRAKTRIDAAGVVHVQNSLVGAVITADGEMAHLDTQARFQVDLATGVLDLNRFDVHYTGD